jgi:hypothetical protein
LACQRADGQGRESVTPDRSEDQRVELGISGESSIEVSAEPVVAVQLVEQFEGDARAESVNALDMPLPPQTTGCG